MVQLTYAERYGWSSAWSTVNLFLGSNVCGGRRCIRDGEGRARRDGDGGCRHLGREYRVVRAIVTNKSTPRGSAFGGGT